MSLVSGGRHRRPSRLPPAPFVAVAVGALAGALLFVVDSSRSAAASPIAAPVSTTLTSRTSLTSLTSTVGDTLPPPPPTTTASGTTTTQFVPRQVTMAFTGDVLVHAAVRNAAASHAEEGQGFDFRPLLSAVEPWIGDVDVAICHLEVNLSADGTRLSGYPAFRAPGVLASDLRAVGYDRCSTASNHTIDFGADGVSETLGVMEEAGLGFSGSARTPEEEAESRRLVAGDVEIAHLSYTYWFNGLQLPEDAPWTSRQIDERRILDDARAARADGAEIVLVSMHWGDEYRNEPNEQQRTVGPRLLASPDIDAIVGHHAHVVQPIDRVDGEWLVYGLGNLLANQSGRSRDELLVRMRFEETSPGRFEAATVEALPLYVDPRSLAPIPSGPDARPEGVAPGLSAELDASFARVTEVLRGGSGWDDLRLVE